MYKAQVYVFLKKSVADPQGTTVKHALESLGYSSVDDVRVGKYIEVTIKDVASQDQAEKQLREMCEKLLVNTVIEDYRFDLEKLD